MKLRAWIPAARLVSGIIGLSALAAVAPQSAAQAEERRCQALGAACFCSEPLDTDQVQRSKKAIGWFSPAEPNAKRCPGELMDGASLFYDKQQTSDIHPVPAAGLGLPSQISFVWENRSRAGVSYAMTTSKGVDPSVKRMCLRYYIRYSPDYTSINTTQGGMCQANKMTQVLLPRTAMLHNQGPHEPAQDFSMRITLLDSDGDGQPETRKARGSGNLRWADCKNEWCRYEVCISGDFAHGKNYEFEGTVVGVTSGKTYIWPRQRAGDSPYGPGTRDHMILNMYRQGTCVGKKWFTHLIEARWTTDAGQRIGPAVEIEGGSPSSGGGGPSASPSPPSTSPSPAPSPTLGTPGRPILVP